MYGNVFLGLESTSYLKLPCIPNPETSQLAWRWGLSSVGVWCQCFGQHLWSSTGGKNLNIRFFLNQAAGVVHVFRLLFFFLTCQSPLGLQSIRCKFDFPGYISPLEPPDAGIHQSWAEELKDPPRRNDAQGRERSEKDRLGCSEKNMESDWVLTDVADVYF